MPQAFWHPDTCPATPGCVYELTEAHVDLGKRNSVGIPKLCDFHRGLALTPDDLYEHAKTKNRDKNFSTAAVAGVLGCEHGDVAWTMDATETVRVDIAKTRVNEGFRLGLAPKNVTPKNKTDAQAAADLAVGSGKVVVE